MAVLLIASTNTVYAYADDKPAAVTQTHENTELTGLALTGFKEPSEGSQLDTSATIVSAEGISWEVPVIWVNEKGESISRAVNENKYIPNIIFFLCRRDTV